MENETSISRETLLAIIREILQTNQVPPPTPSPPSSMIRVHRRDLGMVVVCGRETLRRLGYEESMKQFKHSFVLPEDSNIFTTGSMTQSISPSVTVRANFMNRDDGDLPMNIHPASWGELMLEVESLEVEVTKTSWL